MCLVPNIVATLACLETAAMTTLIEAPDKLSPIMTPAVKYKAEGVVEIDINNRPMLYVNPPKVSTRKLPKFIGECSKKWLPDT